MSTFLLQLAVQTVDQWPSTRKPARELLIAKSCNMDIYTVLGASMTQEILHHQPPSFPCHLKKKMLQVWCAGTYLKPPHHIPQFLWSPLQVFTCHTCNCFLLLFFFYYRFSRKFFFIASWYSNMSTFCENKLLYLTFFIMLTVFFKTLFYRNIIIEYCTKYIF